MKKLVHIRRTTVSTLSLVLAVVAAVAQPSPDAGIEEGIALAIVYDTSGSMADAVPDAQRRATPKYLIANRALTATINRLQSVATNTTAGSPRKIEAGLFSFRGNTATEAVRMGPFDPEALGKWLRGFSLPNGPTPLGDTCKVAGQAVLRSKLTRKHVLVITDGLNTAGLDPTATIPSVQKDAARRGSTIAYHFVAFDINAKHFAGVKKLGATVVGAADEAQLHDQLAFILEEKILLEAEAPPAGAGNK